MKRQHIEFRYTLIAACCAALCMEIRRARLEQLMRESYARVVAGEEDSNPPGP